MASKFNKGDVSEGILAAAITARFVSKTKSITRNDVESIIKKLKPYTAGAKGTTSATEFASANLKKSVVDTVVCFVNLAEVNMKAFLAAGTYKDADVIKLVNASVVYANGPHVCAWANMMYENNQKNKIEVRSEGLLDQSGTKVDLRVVIDGKRTGVGISLKVGDVKQFGQVGGASVETMEEFFGSLGVKFDASFKTKFDKFVSEKKPVEALTLAYTVAHTQLNKLQPKRLRSNLSAFMKFHATRNEENVILLQLNKGQATVYMFEALEEKLVGVPMLVEYKMATTQVIAGAKLPQLLIYGGDKIGPKNLILQLRVKLEGNRVNSKGKTVGLTVRNYVEKGALTTELIAGH
jgi:hypothetical protein